MTSSPSQRREEGFHGWLKHQSSAWEGRSDLTPVSLLPPSREQLPDGLERIDKSRLPGKLQVWCYQFTLYQPLDVALKLSEITTLQY